jgi:hypothetical protein
MRRTPGVRIDGIGISPESNTRASGGSPARACQQ